LAGAFLGLTEESRELTCVSGQWAVNLSMQLLEQNSKFAQSDQKKVYGTNPWLDTLTTDDRCTDEVNDSNPLNKLNVLLRALFWMWTYTTVSFLFAVA